MDLADRFCREPFETLEILADGSARPCCGLSRDFGNVLAEPLEAVWNGPVAQEVRQSILDGSFRHCDPERCPMVHLLPRRDGVAEPRLRDIVDHGMVVMGTAPASLVLSEDVTCNLSCPSCRSAVAMADPGRQQRLKQLAEEVVFPLLELRRPLRLTLSGEGEPLASPHYRSILRHLADNDCGPVEIVLATNGLRFTRDMWREFEGLSRYRLGVSVSIDAATGFTYARLRPPGAWRRLRENLEFISALRWRALVQWLDISMAVQADNYAEMAQFVALGRSLNCDTVSFRRIRHRPHRRAADFARLDIAAPGHPEHDAFMWELRDNAFSDPVCRLNDLASLRDEARALAVVPDDRMAFLTDFRQRHGESAHLRSVEGLGLLVLDQPWRAVQRFLRALELEPSPRRQLHVGLALLRARLPVPAIPYLTHGLGADLSPDDRASVSAHLETAKRALAADAAD